MVEEKEEPIPPYVYITIAVLLAFVIFLGIMFVKTPKRFFGAMKKGTAQAELSTLIDKLNVLEDKLKAGGTAIAGTFAPSGPVSYCSNCGAGNEGDAKFCETCGMPID